MSRHSGYTLLMKGFMVLRFKDSDSYSIAIKHYGFVKRDMMMSLCEEILTEDACKDLQLHFALLGSEINAAQCRNQSAVIVGHYADELKRECFKFAQEVSDGTTPEVVILDLEEFYIGLIREMATELDAKFGQYSSRYHDALSQFMIMCMHLSPHEMIPESRDRRNEKLNSLLEDKRLSAWRAIFKNSDWSEAAVLHEIDGGLSDIVYDSLRRTNGDLDRAIQMALLIVYEDFFIDFLGGDLITIAIDRLEPNDDLKSLLGTVNEVVTHTSDRLERKVTQRAKDIAEPMLDELRAEFMPY